MIAAIVGMPIILMAVTLAVDGVLKRYPRKDDIWQLPKVSSVSFADQRP
ncbi:hypothetical protein [Methylobacterium dankookense]|uniref:Uncharacterized protein n=1 Tax=Methylobacterium dankookense TaxID=560405 RepID=A0A564G556_9HYPH|nr:hypothetical protein [Methylobacterium dankookense]GJD57280.1 hypothetical protein IFDJLNFL_3181 [Methylobacterium dankookense]VUF14691.1 hypothetical protein MTDSW087_04416 [Methylobacterium dankookense]